MASSSSFPHFLAPVNIKLNDFNYREWFTTVCIILLGMDLFSHIDGTSPQPSTPNASLTLANHCTMTLIFQSCEIDVHMEIGHLPTTHAMWDHLVFMFEHSSSAYQYAIIQDLLTYSNVSVLSGSMSLTFGPCSVRLILWRSILA